MKSPITLRPAAHLLLHDPEDYHQIVWRPTNENFNTCSIAESSTPPAVIGLHQYTASQRNLQPIGECAVIINPWTKVLSVMHILFPISRIFLAHSMELASSQSLTSCEHTTRFQWNLRISRKQQLQYLSVYKNIPNVYRDNHQPSAFSMHRQRTSGKSIRWRSLWTFAPTFSMIARTQCWDQPQQKFVRSRSPYIFRTHHWQG